MATLKPLVTTEWLGLRLEQTELRVVDCRFYLAEPARGRVEYDEGHIPSAIYVSLDDDLTGAEGPGRHPLPPVAVFQARMEELGIGSKHTVVAYDHGDGSYAPRLWWMLRSLGHKNVYVLDGGWTAWAAEARPITAAIPDFPRSELVGSSEWAGIVSREDISRSEHRFTLIDARAPERFRGLVEPIDPVAGHIPGAINIPYTGNVDRDGRFLSEQDMQARYRTATDDPVLVAYCGSGVTACSNLLALAIAGRPDALLYPGSWSDWGTAGGEVATA